MPKYKISIWTPDVQYYACQGEGNREKEGLAYVTSLCDGNSEGDQSEALQTRERRVMSGSLRGTDVWFRCPLPVLDCASAALWIAW